MKRAEALSLSSQGLPSTSATSLLLAAMAVLALTGTFAAESEEAGQELQSL